MAICFVCVRTQVGRVSFHEGQLLGLSETRRATLANLTAFALAVADSTTRELGAPLVHRWEGDRLLDILAAELTLEKNSVADAVLEARYLTDPEYELTVRHVLFLSERWRTSAEREAARGKAERALQLLHEGLGHVIGRRGHDYGIVRSVLLPSIVPVSVHRVYAPIPEPI